MKFKPTIIVWAVMSGQDESNLIKQGFANVLRTVNPDVKIICVSTDGVFSQGKGNYSETDEPSLFHADTVLSNYSNAKLHGEALVQSAHKNHVIIRTGPIYGRTVSGLWDKRVSHLLSCLQSKQELYRAANLYRTFVHVDDLSDSIIEICGSEFTGILHVGPSIKESHYTFNKKWRQI